MRDENLPPLTDSSRRYLEAFLAQVRQADLPGKGEVVRQLEDLLRFKPDGAAQRDRRPEADSSGPDDAEDQEPKRKHRKSRTMPS